MLSEKPVITDDSSNLDPLLLDKLLSQVRRILTALCAPLVQ